MPTGPSDVHVFHGLATREASMVRVFDIVRNVGKTDVTVLVRGETGTGKELVARALHAESRRANRPFVAVNCAAFSATLLESELFGHKKGAFTGAIADREGIFQQAHGGTLFLDEVAEIPLALQAKLLRVLQDRTIVPVGGTKPTTFDVRIITATHRALREEVKAGRFREDLMYRIRVVPLFLPPLRDRPRDVDLLLRRLIDAANARGGRRITTFHPDAEAALLTHAWPGNVRELENVVEHAFAIGHGPELVVDDLPPEFQEARARHRQTAPRAMPRDDDAAAIEAALAAAGATSARPRNGSA